MRSTPRSFLAALVLVSTAALVRAQNGGAPAPAPLDAFGTPLSELPAIPFADGRTSAPEPALTIDQSALAFEPLVPLAPAKAQQSTAETARPLASTARMSGQGPAPKSSVEVSASFEQAAAAAGAATVQMIANPPPVAANAAAAKSAESLPTRTGTGGWIILGLVAVALFASITRFRRRLPKRTSITPAARLSLDPEPAPVRVR